MGSSPGEHLVHYLVDTPRGPAGVLEELVYADDGAPTALVVAQGWFARRRHEVPVDEITVIDHRARRVLVTGGSTPVESRGALGTLLDRLAASVRHAMAKPAARNLAGGNSLQLDGTGDAPRRVDLPRRSRRRKGPPAFEDPERL
jgi:hypothetical protein